MGGRTWRVGCGGAALAVLAMAAPAAGASQRVQRTVLDRFGGTIAVDDGSRRIDAAARPGERMVTPAGARASATQRLAPMRLRVGGARAAGYQCVNNRSRRGFVAYQPMYATSDTKRAYLQFVYSLYKQNRARRLRDPRSNSRYTSKQVELCSSGGGHSRGGHRLHRVSTTFTMKLEQPRIIGWKWGKKVRDGAVSASLGFSVPVRPVTINGQVNVHDQDEFTGSQGPDKAASDRFARYKRNQVNGLWEGSDTFIWQGSSHFEGNVAHGLWEFRQTSRTPQVDFEASVAYHCGRIRFVGCD